MTMDTPEPCICCGYTGNWKRHTVLPGTIFRVRCAIFRCPNCGLGRTVPSPVTSLDYYQDNRRYNDNFRKKSELYQKFANNLLAMLDDLPSDTPPRLLDVGCGGGFLVEAASHRGYIAEGVESNQSLVDWGQQRGLRVRWGDVTNPVINDGQAYDVIVLSAILEHLPDPVAVIRACVNLLAPNGRILISQATYDGLLPRLIPWVWYGWQPEEHYWHFTPGAMLALARQSGCQVSKITRTTLHHPWFLLGSVAELAGRNLAGLIARLGAALNRGDQFYIVLTSLE
jgi:SAM-dependent methyltransferase